MSNILRHCAVFDAPCTPKNALRRREISHTYSEYLEIEGDDTYHKATCVICGSVNEKLEHGEPNAENKCPDCGHLLKAATSLHSITIDFTARISDISDNKDTKTSGTFTQANIVYNCSNLYQAKDGQTYYLMLYQKSFVANKTVWAGAITKITATVRGGASGSASYSLQLSDTVMSSVLDDKEGTHKVIYTGGGNHDIVVTADESDNLKYFNLSQTTKKNGQITKIVIEYYS